MGIVDEPWGANEEPQIPHGPVFLVDESAMAQFALLTARTSRVGFVVHLQVPSRRHSAVAHSKGRSVNIEPHSGFRPMRLNKNRFHA